MTILLILYSLWTCVELHFAVLPNKPPQHGSQENAHNWLKLNWLQCRSWKYSPGTRKLIWSTTWARWTKSQASSICTSLRILSMMTSAGNSPERVQSTHRPTTCNNIHHHQLQPCWQTTTHPHTISPFSLSRHRTEPRCITCDLTEVLWSSRYYYANCTHFDVHVSPTSSISTDRGIENYVLECLGPGLPLAGKWLRVYTGICWWWARITMMMTGRHCVKQGRVFCSG